VAAQEGFRWRRGETRSEWFTGAVVAEVDCAAAVAALGRGALPCSHGEAQVLRIAASLAVGVPVDLREAALCLDAANAARVDRAGAVTAVLPATAVITRARHPLAGRELRVLSGMRRHGRLELLLVLPDGSNSLILADWTALAGQDTGPGSAGLGATLGWWRTCSPRPGWRRRIRPAAGPSRSRLHGSHRARRTAMRPVQLSLLPDQLPAPPPPELLAQLPDADVAAAITLLAGLIARAAPAAASPGGR